MSTLSQHVIQALSVRKRFQGIPPLIIEAIVNATIGEIDNELDLGLEDRHQCDGCGQWLPRDLLQEVSEDSPLFCGGCAENYRKECAEPEAKGS